MSLVNVLPLAAPPLTRRAVVGKSAASGPAGARLLRDDGRVQHALVELGVVVASDRVPHAPDRDLRPRHLRACRRCPAVPPARGAGGEGLTARRQLTAGGRSSPGGQAGSASAAVHARPQPAHRPVVGRSGLGAEPPSSQRLKRQQRAGSAQLLRALAQWPGGPRPPSLPTTSCPQPPWSPAKAMQALLRHAPPAGWARLRAQPGKHLAGALRHHVGGRD
jgi:hypothetical protein